MLRALSGGERPIDNPPAIERFLQPARPIRFDVELEKRVGTNSWLEIDVSLLLPQAGGANFTGGRLLATSGRGPPVPALGSVTSPGQLFGLKTR